MSTAVANTTVSMDSIADFCRRWKVRRFSVFGSVIREDFSRESDIDVLLALREDAGLSLWDWIEMRGELQRMFNREIDLVEESGLRNPFRRFEILRTRKVIYAE